MTKLVPDAGNIFLICQFEIENNSDQEFFVASATFCSAYIDDYSVGLESVMANAAMDALEFGMTPLSGTVAPGKKIAGTVNYEVKQDWSELELYLTPKFWPDREIIFTCTNA